MYLGVLSVKWWPFCSGLNVCKFVDLVCVFQAALEAEKVERLAQEEAAKQARIEAHREKKRLEKQVSHFQWKVRDERVCNLDIRTTLVLSQFFSSKKMNLKMLPEKCPHFVEVLMY